MKDDFEDNDGGGKSPTTEQIVRVSSHLQSRGLDHGPRPTHRELLARNFTTSIATVQRTMVKVGIKSFQESGGGYHKANPVTEAVTRLKEERHENHNTRADTSAKKFGLEDVLSDPSIVAQLTTLVDSKNSSAFLAIEENRHRMALNVVIAQMMASKPALLLLDMRGTAALVDALTVAAKLSGGAALDIRYPTETEKQNAAAGLSPDGNGVMKDITPKSTFATSLEQFRSERRAVKNGNGSGA